MAKYVPDVLSHRWVIISSQRLARPDDHDGKKHELSCIFCPGSESSVPNEVYRIGDGEKDKPGWLVRVFPNKYPITDFHEVIVLSPQCDVSIGEMTLSQIRHILSAYRDRFNFYRNKGQVLIFTNYGEHAGASIEHPHSQLVVIPFQINLDTLSREPLNNAVEETGEFSVYCPDFSQWPYELWIAPHDTQKVFGDITDPQIAELAGILKHYLTRMYHIFETHGISHMSYGYNFYIHPKEAWFLRIIPRFIHRAGFELGTGLSVNVIDPLDAVHEYQGKSAEEMEILKKLKKKIK